jgi:tRNA(adenine34) deaminase
MSKDEEFMQQAITLSAQAAKHGNEPFGAVLVKNGQVVYTNENQIYSASDPTFHAETGLIRRFYSEKLITDLKDYTLYTSCEPCFMCSGAMVWAQLGRLVYAASDKDLNSLIGEEGSNCSAIVFAHSYWQPKVTAGVLREQSQKILANYFLNK